MEGGRGTRQKKVEGKIGRNKAKKSKKKPKNPTHLFSKKIGSSAIVRFHDLSTSCWYAKSE